ncbi:hypothetical protein ACFV2S_29300, partial [Streptomyces sp. NPDC059695]
MPSAKATATATTALGLTALLVVGPAPAASAADPDTHITSAAALAHVDYATWRRDVAAVVAEARPYIEARAENAGGEKQAIVLDIDNSSLETDFHPFWELPTPAIADVGGGGGGAPAPRAGGGGGGGPPPPRPPPRAARGARLTP